MDFDEGVLSVQRKYSPSKFGAMAENVIDQRRNTLSSAAAERR